ncbi:Hypothetical protein AKI40_3707 [Enterobacter sp. FY-07]|uniref:hypothetical protein n=1 Tax=Kosakonia oryzendophytica TaxID=1005665 RepID=UPI00078EB1E6|nr:hypothetical protein [Kosakonia oryzendophytica]AMO50084.1 Hypothetical protein AKI40_3707 [Enterobacter sp. FY-07]WBT57080.1 hypothetical protein O9K67_18260 [Kosakonia oryzendophytica]
MFSLLALLSSNSMPSISSFSSFCARIIKDDGFRFTGDDGFDPLTLFVHVTACGLHS